MNRFTLGRITPLQRVGFWLVGCVLVIIFAVSNLGFDISLSQFSAPAEAPPSTTSVDQSFYSTARNLAALAAAPQEQQDAVLAMRAADHELDQGFASAIRHSVNQRMTLTPEMATALRHTAELKEAIRADEAQVAAIGAEPSDPTEDAGERLRVAQAQLALDQDELDNVQQDLTRLGGNQQTEIQQAFDRHRSIEGQASALPKNTATAALESPRSLHSVVGKLRILSSLKERQTALTMAHEKTVTAQHKLQEQRAALARENDAPAGGDDLEPRSVRLAHLRAQSEREKDMAELDSAPATWGSLPPSTPTGVHSSAPSAGPCEPPWSPTRSRS